MRGKKHGQIDKKINKNKKSSHQQITMKVMDFGRVCNDLAIKEVKGKSALELNVAIDRNSGKEKETDFVRVTLWEKRAEAFSQYAAGKGGRVYVEGDLVPSAYIDKEGKARVSLDVRNANVKIIDFAPRESGNSGRSAAPAKAATAPAPAVEDDFGDLDFGDFDTFG